MPGNETDLLRSSQIGVECLGGRRNEPEGDVILPIGELNRLRAALRPAPLHLRERVGMAHPLRAEVGCRNTLFCLAQTGARFFAQLDAAGQRDYRVELLEESAGEAETVIAAYGTLEA